MKDHHHRDGRTAQTIQFSNTAALSPGLGSNTSEEVLLMAGLSLSGF
jgi:hypothetical protein